MLARPVAHEPIRAGHEVGAMLATRLIFRSLIARYTLDLPMAGYLYSLVLPDGPGTTS